MSDIILIEFRIDYTLTDTLARLTGEEQKALTTTTFDLQRAFEVPTLEG